MLLQLEVSNNHNKLQPGSRGHLCTDYNFSCKNIKLVLAWPFTFGSVFDV